MRQGFEKAMPSKLLLAGFVLLLCPAAPGQSPPNPSAKVRFVFRHSGEPAAGLRIVERGRADSGVLTDSDGVAALDRSRTILVSDPERGVDLAIFARGTLPSGDVRIPEPIKLRGAVRGDAANRAGLNVQYGFGDRIEVMARFRLSFDLTPAATRAENRFLGFDIPKSPRVWREATLSPDSSFETAWFPAADDPQVLATNDARQVAIADVRLDSSIRPGAVLNVGELRFEDTRSIAIRFNEQSHDVAADLEVYFRGAKYNPARRDSILKLMSVLDRLDPRTFTFLMGMRGFSTEGGVTEMHILPAFDSIDLRAMGAILGKQVDSTVPLTSPVTTLDVQPLTVLAGVTKRAPLTGLVVLDHSWAPVEGATVVYSCFPDKKQVVTDKFGNFVVPDACVGRRITLFVDATDQARPPRFRRTQKRMTFDRPPGNEQPLVVPLPEDPAPPLAALTMPSSQPATSSGVYRTVQGSPFASWFRSWRLPPNAFFYDQQLGDANDDVPVLVSRSGFARTEFNKLVAVERDPENDLRISVTVAQAGTWDVVMARGACLAAGLDNQQFSANTPKVLTLNPYPEIVSKAYITVFSRIGFAQTVGAGVPAYAYDWAYDPEPTEYVTDKQGVLTLGTCMKLLYLYIYSRKGEDYKRGYFAGEVRLGHNNGATITLKNPPGKKTGSSNPH